MKYIKNDYLVRKYKKVREDKKMTYEELYEKTKIKLKTVEKELVSWEDFQYICELKVEKPLDGFFRVQRYIF